MTISRETLVRMKEKQVYMIQQMSIPRQKIQANKVKPSEIPLANPTCLQWRNTTNRLCIANSRQHQILYARSLLSNVCPHYPENCNKPAFKKPIKLTLRKKDESLQAGLKN